MDGTQIRSGVETTGPPRLTWVCYGLRQMSDLREREGRGALSWSDVKHNAQVRKFRDDFCGFASKSKSQMLPTHPAKGQNRLRHFS